MALTGIHVVNTNLVVFQGATLPSKPAWSQTMDSAGTTTNGAAGTQTSVFQVDAGVDAYFAVGASPNASNTTGTGQGARYLVRAGTTREVFCQPGDKLAWTPA